MRVTRRPSTEFERMLLQLAEETGVRIAFICEPAEDAPGRARALAILHDGEFAEPYDYALEGTPCGRVYARGSLFHAHGLRSMYPGDAELESWGVDTYLGVAMVDKRGRMLGHVGVMNDEPLSDPAAVETRLRSLAKRVGKLLHERSA